MTGFALIAAAGLVVTWLITWLAARRWVSAARPRHWGVPDGWRRPVGYTVMVVVGVALTVAVVTAYGHLVQLGPIKDRDRSVYRVMLLHQPPGLIRLASHYTGFGNLHVDEVLGVVLGLLVMAWTRSVRALLLLALAVPVEDELQKRFAHLVHSVKPSFATSLGPPGGFPSGGVTRVLVLTGFVAVLVGGTVSVATRRLLLLLATTLAYLEGVSRFALGRHWLVDVLAGFLFGGLVVVTVALAESRLRLANAADGGGGLGRA